MRGNKSNSRPVPSGSRLDALADGSQVDVSRLAQAVGFHLPVFLTREAFARLTPSAGFAGRATCARLLWRVLEMLRHALAHMSGVSERIRVACHGSRPGADSMSPIRLLASLGPLDHADPTPALTVDLEDRLSHPPSPRTRARAR